MRYITITAKHHDGFALFDSQHSGWDTVDRTVYGKDVLAQLADACRRHGLRLFFYYSQLDWWHDDYFPRGRTGHHSGRPDQGDWAACIGFMNAQLTALLTNYGEVAGIWFDGWWDRPDADWRQDSLLIPELGRPIERVSAFPAGEALAWDATDFGTLLRLPRRVDGPDTTVEITLGVK